MVFTEGTRCVPKSAALQQVEQQWTTSSVCSLTDMLATGLCGVKSIEVRLPDS